MIRVHNVTRGRDIVTRGTVADTFWKRLLGLIGRKALAPGEGLLIRPSKGIHTWWMRFPIDVIYLDATYRVVDVDENVLPWRFGRPRRAASMVLEVPAGTVAATGTCVGDLLRVEISQPSQAH